MIDLKKMKSYKVRNFPDSLPNRKNHIGFYFQSSLFILGGIYSKKRDNILYSVNLFTCFIKKEKIKNFDEYLSHHKCVTISTHSCRDLRIKFCYNTMRKNKKQMKPEKSIPIVYIFGGMNRKKISNNFMRCLT